MEILLTTDVPKVGKKYSVVNVAPGFARNFLIARGLGEAVTKQNAKRVSP
jgi:ribosomal protein L9